MPDKNKQYTATLETAIDALQMLIDEMDSNEFNDNLLTDIRVIRGKLRRELDCSM